MLPYNSFNTLSKSARERLIEYLTTLTLLSRMENVIFRHYLRNVESGMATGKQHDRHKNVSNLTNQSPRGRIPYICLLFFPAEILLRVLYQNKQRTSDLIISDSTNSCLNIGDKILK